MIYVTIWFIEIREEGVEYSKFLFIR